MNVLPAKIVSTLQHQPSKPAVSFLSFAEARRSPELIRDWEQLLAASGNLHMIYQSPAWAEHLLRKDLGSGKYTLGIVRGPDARLLGVVPLVFENLDLDVRVKTFTLLKNRLHVAHVLGNVPLLPEDAGTYEAFFAELWARFPRCQGAHFRMVPTSSFCWRQLRESRALERRCFLYMADAPCLHHSIVFPKTFEEYLSKFKSKHRSEMKRQVKQLRQHGNGSLELQRVEKREDVPAFLKAAAQLVRASWQGAYTDDPITENDFWLEEFTDLADRGMLRSYVLHSGGQPCAFAFGYDYAGIHYADQTAYDSSLRELSPGTILHFLELEDLIENHPPLRLSFGFGHSDYKQTFSNVHSEEGRLLLVRKTLANRLRCGSHAAFRRAVPYVKRALTKVSAMRARLRGRR